MYVYAYAYAYVFIFIDDFVTQQHFFKLIWDSSIIKNWSSTYFCNKTILETHYNEMKKV